MGLRLRDLGTERLSWGDLWAIVTYSPPESALHRARNPEEAAEAEWTLTNQLLAAAVDALRVGNWQRGGGAKRDYPKPIARPGIEPTSTTYGKGAIPYDEMADWLGWT